MVVLDAGKLVEQGSPSDLLTPDADGRTGLQGLDSAMLQKVLDEMGFYLYFPMVTQCPLMLVFPVFPMVFTCDLDTDPIYPMHPAIRHPPQPAHPEASHTFGSPLCSRRAVI